MQKIAQGVSYGRFPKSPHAVNASLFYRDFSNPVSFVPNPSTIPHPDAYNPETFGLTFPPTNVPGYGNAQAALDISQEMKLQGMEFIQSVYVDNADGLGVVILRSRTTGMRITVPPCSQGTFPMILPMGSSFVFDVAYIDSGSGDSNGLGPTSFTDYPDVSADFSGGGGVINGKQVESGSLRFQFTDMVLPLNTWNCRNNSSGYWYDMSGTIVAANTFQSVSTGNYFRKGWLVHNPITAAEPLYWAPHYPAAPQEVQSRALGLNPGQTYEDRAGMPYIGVIRLMAATGGHPYVFKIFK